MKNFLVESFFDLETFAQSRIFEECQYAWEALGALEAFFESADLGTIECPIPEGAILVHPELISIGEGTVIEPGTFIQGPCIIGRECEVRHGAYIRGHLLAGDRCIVGHTSELKRSILLDDVCAAHFNYVGDSILGNRVNLGAGVKLANLRLDHQEVQLDYQGKKVSTGLKKLGALLGDGVQIGCNAVTNPGTLIGKGAFCHPCIAVQGVVPPRAKVRSTHKTVVQEYVDRSCF